MGHQKRLSQSLRISSPVVRIVTHPPLNPHIFLTQNPCCHKALIKLCDLQGYVINDKHPKTIRVACDRPVQPRVTVHTPSKGFLVGEGVFSLGFFLGFFLRLFLVSDMNHASFHPLLVYRSRWKVFGDIFPGIFSLHVSNSWILTGPPPKVQVQGTRGENLFSPLP